MTSPANASRSRFGSTAVLVTGAARGFGRAIAERFAAEGARLVLTDILADPLAETAAALRDRGAQVEMLAADITQEQTSRSLVDLCVKAYGRVDIAINNAGIAHENKKLPALDGDVFRRVIETNLMSVYYGMKYQIPVMEAQNGGVILNMASVAGLIGAPFLGAYTASKHAVVGLTKSTAAEYARSGIRINALCPSFASTPMVNDMLATMKGSLGEALARTVGAIPMRRLATADEVAQAVLWMCEPGNSFMTGTALALDGGLTAV